MSGGVEPERLALAAWQLEGECVTCGGLRSPKPSGLGRWVVEVFHVPECPESVPDPEPVGYDFGVSRLPDGP